MRPVTFFTIAAVLATMAQAGSAHSPINQNAIRHQHQDEQQHRPLGQTLGTFTEEQESTINRIQQGKGDREAGARRMSGGANLFRPRSNANEEAVIDRAINRKQRQNRLRSSPSPSAPRAQADGDGEEEDEEDGSDDTVDEPIIQRYDV